MDHPLRGISYTFILDYAELYDIINKAHHPDMAEAQRQISGLTDEEWHDWIEYRSERRARENGFT
jgi:hypothetical protein